jgi:hypothetical protein
VDLPQIRQFRLAARQIAVLHINASMRIALGTAAFCENNVRPKGFA